MKISRCIISALCALALGVLLLPAAASAEPVELVIDSAHPAGEIDLTRYSLGQGGLSHEPMFDVHLDQVARLKPRTIRLFVQEYFDLYPERGRYHWDTLDRSLENILATGAKPLMSLCFKPRILYPQTDQDIVHPTDYAEWEALIEALVRHCNLATRLYQILRAHGERCSARGSRRESRRPGAGQLRKPDRRRAYRILWPERCAAGFLFLAHVRQ